MFLLLLKPQPLSSKLLRPLILSSPLSASISSSTSSSATEASVPLSFTDLAVKDPTFNLNPTRAADVIKQWFKSGTNDLDVIYSILSSTPDGPPLSAALSSLRLRLSETLVLDFLSHRPHPSSLPPSPPSSLLLLRLKFFDWAAHHPGPYRHTRATYHAVFRLLSRAFQVSTILQWLHQFSSLSFLNRHSFTRFHDTLIVGYAVAGQPERAFHLFGKMRFQGLDLDSFGYHVLLNSLIDASLFDFAAALADQIRARGLVGPVTHCITAKMLIKQGLFDEAVAHVRRMRDSPLSGRMVSMLVGALCKSERFDEAGELTREFGDDEAYGVWVSSLIQNGKLDLALKFLQVKKVEEDYSPEDLHYNRLIHEFLKRNRLGEVYDLLFEMIEEGTVPNQSTMNSVLCFFCKAGMVEVAVQLYHSSLELGLSPSNRLYNHLISELCKSERVEEVCQVLEESLQSGYFPRKQTFNILAATLSREEKFEKLCELLDGACQRAINPSTEVLARCISSLCRAGQLEKGWALRDMFDARAKSLCNYKFVYISLIRAVISLKRVNLLPDLVIQMQKNGHTLSRNLYRTVVCCLCKMDKFDTVLDLLNTQLELNVVDPKTCYTYFIFGAASAEKPEMAREVYNQMVKAGISPNLDTELIVLRGLVKSMRVKDAFRFFAYFRDRRKAGTKFYNIFITDLCEAGKVDVAVTLWQEMREKGLIPSLNCYELLLLASCAAEDYNTTILVLEDLMVTKRPISTFICNLLLLHTLKGKELWRAWENLKNSEESKLTLDQRMLVELIKVFSGGIRMNGNLNSLDEVVEGCFPIDVYTYNLLLRCLTQARKMDCARDLVFKMKKKGHEPNLFTYDIMLQGYCIQGNLEEAKRWKGMMRSNGYQPTWCTMRKYN